MAGFQASPWPPIFEPGPAVLTPPDPTLYREPLRSHADVRMAGLEVEGHGDDGEQVASEDGRPREGSQDVLREDHRDKEEPTKEENEEENQAEAVVRVLLGQADQPGGDGPDREEDDG